MLLPAHATRERILAEVEFAIEHAVTSMCCFHVFRRPLDRDIEVQIETQDSTGNEDDEDAERGVFKIGHLDFHGPEFNAPADVVLLRRWGLEAHMLPVSGLEVLKVVCFVEV